MKETIRETDLYEVL